MNLGKNIKKQSFLFVFCAILLAVVVGGTSYALFFQVNTNTNNQVVQTGTLSVTYGAGSSAISETNLLPLTDTEGLNSTTLNSTVLIENQGSLPADYTIKIGNDLTSFQGRSGYTESDVLLNHDYIRIAVYKNGNIILNPTTLSSLQISSDDNTMYDLHSDKLDVQSSGDNSDTYSIKIWVSAEAPVSVIGNFVFLKIDVTSTVDEILNP